MLRLVFLLVAVPLVILQVRKPSRGIGRLFLWSMNRTHSGLPDWGLTQVPIEKRATILDIGCGGGRTVQKMAAVATDGMVYGVDYSAESVAVSRATNAASIKAGRVDIRQASVARLPFGDDQFDLVTAVETHYYWPALRQNLGEVLRVLKPGATVIMIAESYKGGKYDRLHQIVMKPLGAAHLSATEFRDLFTATGYADVRTGEETKRGWLYAIGHKPRRS